MSSVPENPKPREGGTQLYWFQNPSIFINLCVLPKIPKIWGKTQPFWYPNLENWTRLEPITISDSFIIWALFSCNRLNLLEIWLWKIDTYYTPTEAVSKCIPNWGNSSEELRCIQKHKSKTQGRIMTILCLNLKNQ